MALIGLISDVHAASGPVAQALSIFAKAGVEQVLCAGDIAGYNDELGQTVKLLVEGGCQTIMGNHDLQYLAKCSSGHADAADNGTVAFLKALPATYETMVEGKSVYMVHAQPPDGCHGGIKLLDKKGDLLADNVAYWQEKLQSFDYDVDRKSVV